MDIKYASYADIGKRGLQSAMLGSVDVDRLSGSDADAYEDFVSKHPGSDIETLRDQVVDTVVVDLYVGIDLSGEGPPVQSMKGFNEIWSVELGNIFDTKEEAAKNFWKERYNIVRALFR